ncbi:hypothetical protein [Bacillus sp. JJ722]|uniref:hypothetical protein n=1 Tax=Bacillus sp. JJ722 TaxID=3122973 RepID=UPI002FFFEEE4
MPIVVRVRDEKGVLGGFKKYFDGETPEEKTERLEATNAQLESSLIEMSEIAAYQEQRNIQNEKAIMELTMIVGGKA